MVYYVMKGIEPFGVNLLR